MQATRGCELKQKEKDMSMNRNDALAQEMEVEWWHMFGGSDGQQVTRDISRAERGEELCRITEEQAEELARVPVSERWQAAQRMMQGES